IEKLEEYVDGGGNVLLFLGDRVNATFYNENLFGSNRRHGGLLPGRLVRREGDPSGQKDPATISAVNYDHAALSIFQDPRYGLGGRAVTFKALWRMEVPAENVLMKASTGAPLLAEKTFGRGRVVAFTSTCDADWTNFPTRPVFLPWMHRLVPYLAQNPLASQGFWSTGATVRIPTAALKRAASALVETPDGKAGVAGVEAGDEPSLLFSDTAIPGIYKVMGPDQKEPLGLFAVNL